MQKQDAKLQTNLSSEHKSRLDHFIEAHPTIKIHK
jgi:hypothetical protein